MNLSQLRLKTRSHLNDGVGPKGQWSDDEIGRLINDAYSTISEMSTQVDRGWRSTQFQFSTLANQKTYSLPGDMQIFQGLARIDGECSISMLPIQGDGLDVSLVTGAPYYRQILGSQIDIYPIPDGQYPMIIRYVRVTYPMSMDTDEPVDVLAGYHDMIPLLAAIYAAPKFQESRPDLKDIYQMREVSLIRSMSARTRPEAQRTTPWWPQEERISSYG